MEPKIGWWVRRLNGRKDRATKWHLVDSVVAGDAFTRCGRRMKHDSPWGPLETFPTMPLTRMIGQPQNCSRCD